MASSLLKLHSQIFSNNSHLSPPTPKILSRHSLPFFSVNKTSYHNELISFSIDLPKRSKLPPFRVHSSLSSTNPPTSREEAITQAKNCLSKALEKPLNNPNLTGRVKKLKQPKFQLEIPIIDDDSPSSLSQLALEIFGSLPVKRNGSKVVKILILWANSKLRDAAIAAFSSSAASENVKHVDISAYDIRSLSGADVAVFLVPERTQIAEVKRVANGLYPNPVVIFNPKWGFEGDGGGGFVDSFEVIYSFMGLEVQGVLSKRKGVIFKSGEGLWNVLVEEGNGEMKVISQFKGRPSIDEVENVLYNLMAINSPISKSARFISDLVSNVTGRK